VLYLDLVSPALGRLYFNTALRLCSLTGVQPSILLHPLDFRGSEVVPMGEHAERLERSTRLRERQPELRRRGEAFGLGGQPPPSKGRPPPIEGRLPPFKG